MSRTTGQQRGLRQFPGSPLELRYTFRLNEQGKILRLDISP